MCTPLTAGICTLLQTYTRSHDDLTMIMRVYSGWIHALQLGVSDWRRYERCPLVQAMPWPAKLVIQATRAKIIVETMLNADSVHEMKRKWINNL